LCTRGETSAGSKMQGQQDDCVSHRFDPTGACWCAATCRNAVSAGRAVAVGI
jgi:hypothetical protein